MASAPASKKTSTRRKIENGPLIRVKNLKKYFPVHTEKFFHRQTRYARAVDGVSFELGRGKTLGLVGESGCGKTTMGRTLLRLEEPTAGSFFFDGNPVFDLKKEDMRRLRRRMQIIFQDPYSSLNPRQAVGSIIGEAMKIHRIGSRRERRERTEWILTRVGLLPMDVNRYPHEFSGGGRQRIAIARAVAIRPDFIVCDEPVSALDVSIQAQIINLLEELQGEFQLSYLFVAHDLHVVRHISDEVAVMYLGKIVERASTDELFEAPLHPYTRALLAAVPRTEPGADNGGRVILGGDIPSPLNPPRGCAFHTRCPEVIRDCARLVPRHREISEGHWVSCIRV
ncbi:MAG: dipeptide ABC transporter ATP-binding protein [Candidatus Brocadiales bacterium]